MTELKFYNENKGKYFMRISYGIGTGIIESENSGYYFTKMGGAIGKHNVNIITEKEYNALNAYYANLRSDEFCNKDGISYMDALDDLKNAMEIYNA